MKDPQALDARPESTTTAQTADDVRLDAALRSILRAPFVDETWRMRSFEDAALPAGGLRMCPSPSSVRALLSAASVQPGERVLVVLAGSGYVGAVLHACGANVEQWDPDADLRARTHVASTRWRVQSGAVLERVDEESIGEYASVVIPATLSRAPRALATRLRHGASLVACVERGSLSHVVVYRNGPKGLARRDHGPARFERVVGSHAQKVLFG
jgi:protein-L-isoaspartate O-methyltransferase